MNNADRPDACEAGESLSLQATPQDHAARSALVPNDSLGLPTFQYDFTDEIPDDDEMKKDLGDVPTSS